jgi:predicted nucleic acid-binding protein
VIGEVVVDASALVHLLADDDEVGEWVREQIAGLDLHAPELVLFETANVLRQHERDGLLSADMAALALADLVALPIELCSFAPLAERVWELRHNLTAYDAAYVALAELGEVGLVTIDRRLANAPGVQCTIVAPPTP